MFYSDPVNIFFSCDDGYIPFLAVTLESIKATCDMSREYDIRVLHVGLSRENIKKITMGYDAGNFRIRFFDISHEVTRLGDSLYTRDYYSKSTYYRLFIPDLFPNIHKALYLDCDIVLRGDVSELYDTYLGTNLVGAVTDGIVDTEPELSLYAEKRIGLRSSRYYFNAGVLLMNLEGMREFGFRDVFLSMLSAVKYTVAQDQDYLNVICKDRVRYVGYEWNAMPEYSFVPENEVKLAHYNLDNKPWRKEGVQFGKLFWQYADRTPYIDEINAIYAASSPEKQAEAARGTENVIRMGYEQATDEEENARVHEAVSAIVPKASRDIIKKSRKYLGRFSLAALAFLR